MPTQELTPTTALAFVLEARGAVPLALERLSKHLDHKVTHADLIASLANAKHELAEQLHVMAILESWQMLQALQAATVAGIVNLEAKDAATLYASILAQIGKLTDDKTLQLNVKQEIWQMVPRELQEYMADEAIEAEYREVG